MLSHCSTITSVWKDLHTTVNLHRPVIGTQKFRIRSFHFAVCLRSNWGVSAYVRSHYEEFLPWCLLVHTYPLLANQPFPLHAFPYLVKVIYCKLATQHRHNLQYLSKCYNEGWSTVRHLLPAPLYPESTWPKGIIASADATLLRIEYSTQFDIIHIATTKSDLDGFVFLLEKVIGTE